MGEDLTARVVPIVDVETGGGPLRRQWLYRLTAAAVTVVVAGALVDAAGLYPVYGVDSRHVVASGGGYELEVSYAVVSRTAVDTPFDI